MASKYFLEHSLWHKAYVATWRQSCGWQVKQSLILDECQRFSPSSPAIPEFINITKLWMLQPTFMFIVTKNIGSVLLKRVWRQYHFYQFSQASPTLINWRVPGNVIFCTGKPWAQLLARFLTCADPHSSKQCPSTALQSDFSKEQSHWGTGHSLPNFEGWNAH